MQYGFYTAASGVLTHQRNLQVIANNLANVSTAGYKTERVVTDTLDYNNMMRFENGYKTKIGKNSPMLRVKEVITGFEESAVQETGFPYDIGLVGEGFFNIKGGERTFLTRNGNFDMDPEGYLILPGHGRVQGKNGDLYVGGSDWRITDEGQVYDNQGNFVDEINVTMPNDLNSMKKFTNGLYLSDDVRAVEFPTTYQGMLERSNIDMNTEYTKIMEVQNAFSACSSALKILDQMNSRATNLCSING